MSNIFSGAEAFNQPVPFDTSSVKNVRVNLFDFIPCDRPVSECLLPNL